MFYQRLEGCDGCFKPDKKRLASLQPKADYDCYGESYVKCFWGLCDHQKTMEPFAVKSSGPVIMKQPRRTIIYNQYLVENQ